MDLQHWFIINLEKVNREIYLVNNLSTLQSVTYAPFGIRAKFGPVSCKLLILQSSWSALPP